MRLFDIITFDWYGTLINWETGMAEAFQETAAADGVRSYRLPRSPHLCLPAG